MSINETWTDIDAYISDHLLPSDKTMEKVLRANSEAGLPAIDVSPPQAKMLHLLIKIKGSKRVLELGTLGGYSSIWMARALPPEGQLVTLEAEERHAEVAASNIRMADLDYKINIHVGTALDTLPKLASEDPFDFIFIDADKKNNCEYIQWAVELSESGACLIIDNVVRGGEVLKEDSLNEDVVGIRKMFDLLHDHPRIDSTAIQTVGAKGHDGFLMAVIK